MEFTKDTSKVLTAIYKIYLERRKDGIAKKDAIFFKLDFYKNVSSLSSFAEDDINDSLSELSKSDFIKKYVSGNFTIQDSLIVHMENRFKNGIEEVTKYLVDLAANIVPGLVL